MLTAKSFVVLTLITIVSTSKNCNYGNKQGVCERSCDRDSQVAMVRLNMATKFCDDNINICCLKVSVQVTTRKPPVPLQPTQIAEQKCTEYSELTFSTTSEDKIVGGVKAEVGEFPHMAALGYGDKNDVRWSCGGSLISDRFILTAGHCLNDRINGPPKYVLLGDIILSKNTNIEVKRIHIHNNYKPRQSYNDIGLIEINPIQFSDKIRPACLLTKNFDRRYELIATGWGLLEHKKQTDVLHKVKLEYVDCPKALLAATRLLPEGFRDTQFCAGMTGKDTCRGDSGGPLQFFHFTKKIHYIAGITSFGPNNCGGPIPAVYTNVNKYISWIVNIVWPK